MNLALTAACASGLCVPNSVCSMARNFIASSSNSITLPDRVMVALNEIASWILKQ
jgi:hypothetical protein